MLVAHPIYLRLPIEVLEVLGEVCCPAYALGLDSLENLHVHVKIDVGLRKGQDGVHRE